MKISSRMLGTTMFALLALSAIPALADQEDKDACVGLEEDEACTRGDGDAGTCMPDESDPSVLTCDDDGGAGGSGGNGGDDSGGASGCSTSGGSTGAPLPFVAFALAALAAGRRRRR